MATVLLADDDADARFALALLLRTAGGHAVLEADGCDAAVQAVARERPDVVVTEVMMEGMTTMDFIERLREAGPSTGIVAISGGGIHQDPETAVSLASTAGADRTLRKPVRNSALLAAVSELMASDRSGRSQ